MQLSSRQQSILIELLKYEDTFVSLSQIAEQLQVSIRTIQREIRGMEHFLTSRFSLTLEKQTGEGIRLVGPKTKKELVWSTIEASKPIDFSPSERKTLILQTLLASNQPLKILALALQCKVTPATISSDLDEIEQWLENFQLQLTRKRGSGIEITGDESSKRQAMSSLLSENFRTEELIQLLRNRNVSAHHVQQMSHRLLGLVNQEILSKAERVVHTVLEEVDYPLADSAYIALSVHLALLIQRIKSGEAISFDPDTLKDLQNTVEYSVAVEIINRLQDVLELKIPNDEIGYVTMHLMGSKLRLSLKEEMAGKEQSVELRSKAKEILDHCANALGTTWSDENESLNGLTTHLGPALFRIKSHMPIRNPMLPVIRQRYEKLFSVVHEVCRIVFPTIPIPDEEVGYILMHVGSSLQISTPQLTWPNAYVICSSGIGTSKMLATQIRQQFPQIESIQNISMFELENINTTHPLISTIPLPKLQSKDYVVISPFLTEEDKKKLQQYLYQFTKNKSDKISTFQNVSVNTNAPLSQMKLYTEIALELIGAFQVLKIDNQSLTKRETLERICSLIQPESSKEHIQLLVTNLMHREETGGIGIPDGKLALFHSRSDLIKKVSFHICSLSEKIPIHSMTGGKMMTNRLIMLLSPVNVSKEHLNVLSEVSTLLLDQTAIAIFQTNTKATIIDFLEQHFSQYIIRQVQKERSI
ncbi:BglG family transcription antiterminator [Risungbinella massiliensis]|uniref:BglG family transcription antiterminator n=1 Tax=Risungbinella massiliensis TaxID=1329796 RepID=UPI0005CC3100|nr:BglG family transcription antiterminator [Risungbinella massiliensis]